MNGATLELIRICAAVSVFTYVFSRGLGTRIVDLGYFYKRPVLMIKSFLAIDVLVPLVAIAIIILINPVKPTAIGLILLSASPAAPLVLRAVSKAKGKREYAVSLQVLMASLAIVTTPATIYLLSDATGLNLGVDPALVAESIGLSVLVPLLSGIAARWLFPAIAIKIIKPLRDLSVVALLALFALVLLSTYRLLFALDLRSYLAMALLVIGSLASGHVLAWKHPEERKTLAIESATRNSGLALLIAADFAPLEKALPVLVPYVVTSALICFIYARLLKKGKAG